MKQLAKWTTFLSLLILSGCGGDTAQSLYSDAADSNGKRLGGLYLQYQVRNRQNPMLGPASIDDFKSFIQTIADDRLEMLGVDKNNVDELFVSGRDNSPYKVRMQVQGVLRGPAQPVIFEKTGIDGKFMVAFTGFSEKEVDQAEYDRLWSGEADGS